MTSSQNLAQGNLAHFLHGFTHLPTLKEEGPLVVERGEGVYVYDVHGRKYIEGTAGLWNAVVGFSEQRLIEAAFQQMQKLPVYHTFFGRTSKPVIDLAERLARLAPTHIKHAFLTNSGSEANETAIKILWMINRGLGRGRKRKIISRRGAYHGTTIATASLTGKDYIEAFGLPIQDVLFTDCPHYWRYGRDGETEEEFATRLARNLETLIRKEGPDTIAAFIAEPVLGAGGVITPPKTYFEKIQNVLHAHQIPFIADEVICGFGRTGEMWGCDTYGIKPDIITTSKCLTSGYFPMGAVMLSADVHADLMGACEEFSEFPHGFTTGGHPVGAAVALKTLDLITEDGLLANLVSVSPRFQERLRNLAHHPLVGEARGIGLTGAIELVSDKATGESIPAEHQMGEKIVALALKHGLIIRPIGDSVIFAPPFIITEGEIDEMFDRLEKVLSEVDGIVRQRPVALK